MGTTSPDRMSAIRQAPRVAASGFGRAFTFAELLVVLGVIGVLLSLLLPALGAAAEQARRTSDAATLRQNFTAVTLYAQDRSDVFPVADSNIFEAARHWYRPLVDTGHLSDASQADPRTWRRHGAVSFMLSVCLVYDADLMVPGQTVSPTAPASGIRIDQVVYPSSKGGMLKNFNGITDPQAGGVYFCCTSRWVVPVAMVDGSVEFGDYLDYSDGQPVTVIDGVGIPVYSSWGGYRARDR